jgi:hypothetical protein
MVIRLAALTPGVRPHVRPRRNDTVAGYFQMGPNRVAFVAVDLETTYHPSTLLFANG